jgi:hypothetical protein
MIIIIVDMRSNNGHVCAIVDDNDNLAEFDTEEDAEKCMENHPLNVFPIKYIDIDEV